MAQKTARSDKEYVAQFGEGLSDTTQRAHWVGGMDEHEDRPGETLVTRNHDVIMDWAKQRQAKPSTIAGTEHGDRPGVLRLDFPGYDDSGRLQEIPWDKWFETFEARDLVFVYQEHLKNGSQSNFFRMDSPHREQG
jgi:hypothetical protein